MTNPLRALNDHGQSVWLDYIRRSLITSGKLQHMVEEDGLRGVTSNPAIFQKAIAGSTDYKQTLAALVAEPGLDVKTIYERLAIEDIQLAADIMRPVYTQTKRRDGYISLEVSPHLAHDTQGTCAEARRLWKAVGRENLLVKVPATPEGIPAITQLISEGINVNVTLIFSREVYAQVAEAYLHGLETYAKGHDDPGRIASVASFFVSRIDSAVDGLVDERLAKARTVDERTPLQWIHGKVAIANAKLAYARYHELFSGARWEALAKRGAQTQRLLWASTGTKNPTYSDVLYVEELIGPETVNTIPPSTYDAFRNHGRVRKSLEEDLQGAKDVMALAEQQGIRFEQVTEKLLTDGLTIFADAFDALLGAVEAVRNASCVELTGRQTYHLPKKLAKDVDEMLERWQAEGNVRRLWAQDASLWTGTDEAEWMGWLGITEDQTAHLDHLRTIVGMVKTGTFTHILLLGMGGSSLAPEVLTRTFGKMKDFPELHVLDSTDPAQIKAMEQRIDLTRTLFIVSSKSGSTLEPSIFKDYFFEQVKQAVGADEVGGRFVAITDPNSKLEAVAERDGFRWIYFGRPSIGGRFSALSDFGMIPAAAMGLDVAKFLDRTDEMVHACFDTVPIRENPGVVLGAILGVLGTHGRDKVTLIASPGLADLGAWLEQLLAESTGKQGKGLIPVAGEPVAKPSAYGADRLFIYIRLGSGPDATQDAAVEKLEQAGHPVVRIIVNEPYDLGQEFFRWEIATAVAGAILGINPFNQPDVEASKVATRQLTTDYETHGSLPPETPVCQGNGMALFTDEKNARALAQTIGDTRTLARYVAAHLGRLQAGDYFAILAYLEMNAANQHALQAIRTTVRDAKQVATCVGFGPRFLHSTGQAYKGGPNSGVFLQLTCNDPVDLEVPGAKYTFGVVKAAQAQGDFQVLTERDRRILRVHLGDDVAGGLRTLQKFVEEAVA